MDDDEDDYDSEEDEDDYDFDPEELGFGEDVSDDESDELDDVDNPRVAEVDSDEEEIPKLVEAKKGKNKRAAEEAEGLDAMIAKAADSKKQQKKLKNNKGEAVAAEESKKDKKVQFAKNLEQGPTGSGKQTGKAAAAAAVKVVQGVTVDDRTLGKGRTVKSGDTVGVRYIGKLANGQQFDGKSEQNMCLSTGYGVC
jgi:FK506-binding nuclear protein